MPDPFSLLLSGQVKVCRSAAGLLHTGKRDKSYDPLTFAIVGAFASFVAINACASAAQLEAFEIVGDAIVKPLGGLKGDPSRGEAIAVDRRAGNCLICHKLPLKDEPFQGEIGPSLIGVGSRLTEGQMRLRVVDQSKLNPDTLMPPYYRVTGLRNVAPEYAGLPALSAQQVEDVVAYLASLKN